MMNFLFLVAHAVTISTAIPGTNPNSTSSSPGAFVANFYQFALMIGGILALGAIVYGGVRYVASAGNPSAQSDGKEWIWGALIGLLLLAGAYLVLNVVNPQLVNLNLPTLNQISAVNNTTVAPGNYTTASTCQATSNGGSTGTCQPDASGKNQNCCNLNGLGICTTDSCSDLSNLQCRATSNGGTTGSCPNLNGAAQNCCYSSIDDSAICVTETCADFAAEAQ